MQNLDVRIVAPENIPATGGAMIAINHTGYWDFVYGGIPAHFNGNRLVRFMAKKEIFDVKGVGALMRAMKHIPGTARMGRPALRKLSVAFERGSS